MSTTDGSVLPEDPSPPVAIGAGGLSEVAADNDRLLTGIGRLSPPGSTLLVEHVPTAGARPPDTDGDGHVLDTTGASWRSTQDAPTTWLHRHGWTARPLDAGAAAALGRDLPPVLDRRVVGGAAAWLLHATR